MMSSKFCAALAIFVLVLASQSGCLLSHSRETIVRQAEPLAPLTFASESARSTFEQAATAAVTDDSNEARSSFGIPFLVGLNRTTRVAKNAIRNDVATLFDLNHDRHISDYEASLRR